MPDFKFDGPLKKIDKKVSALMGEDGQHTVRQLARGAARQRERRRDTTRSRNALLDVWNEPIDEPCPECNHPLLTIKVTKRRGTEKVCRFHGNTAIDPAMSLDGSTMCGAPRG